MQPIVGSVISGHVSMNIRFSPVQSFWRLIFILCIRMPPSRSMRCYDSHIYLKGAYPKNAHQFINVYSFLRLSVRLHWHGLLPWQRGRCHAAEPLIAPYLSFPVVFLYVGHDSPGQPAMRQPVKRILTAGKSQDVDKSSAKTTKKAVTSVLVMNRCISL